MTPPLARWRSTPAPTSPTLPRVIFEALADGTRRRLLELLSGGEQPVGVLVAALDADRSISQPAVSQHLKVLRDAGLVTVRAEGTRRLHALDPAGVEIARAWLRDLGDPLAPLAQPLDALATEVARGRRARRGDQPAGHDLPGAAGPSVTAG